MSDEDTGHPSPLTGKPSGTVVAAIVGLVIAAAIIGTLAVWLLHYLNLL